MKLFKKGKENGSLKSWALPFESIALTLFAFVVPTVIFVTFVQLVFKLDTQDKVQEFLSRPVVNFSLYAFLSGVSFLMIRVALKRRRRTFSEIGFNRPKAFDVVNIFAAYAVYMIVLRIIFAAIISLMPNFDTNQVQETGYNNAVGIDVVYAFFGLVVLAPLFEELLFRGVLYNGLKQKMSILPAAIITSLIFAALHSPWLARVDVFILSFALIWLLEVSGSIWASVGLHAFKNFLAFYILFIHR